MNVVEKKKISCTGVSTRDQRGKKEPTNETPQCEIDLVKQHIKTFPVILAITPDNKILG